MLERARKASDEACGLAKREKHGEQRVLASEYRHEGWQQLPRVESETVRLKRSAWSELELGRYAQDLAAHDRSQVVFAAPQQRVSRCALVEQVSKRVRGPAIAEYPQAGRKYARFLGECRL